MIGRQNVEAQTVRKTRTFKCQNFRKVKFMSAILGPEMAAPILWAPRISAFFLQENLHVHKIPRFWGGGGILGLGGGKCRFFFMGAGIFLKII